MKYCPTCQTEYDEEIIRFCTKDGTPLIDKDAPEFTEMPSETSEEIEETDEFQTVIRRKEPVSSGTEKFSGSALPESDEEDSQRIVIPTKDVKKEQPVRIKRTVPPPPPAKKSNTTFVVLSTILGTLVLLAGILGVYWFLTGSTDDDVNANSDINTNVDENLDDNFNSDDLLDNLNADSNLDENLNLNTNFNINTPTPTPVPTPTKTPTPNINANANVNANTNANLSNTNAAATPTPPRPTATPTPVPSPPPPANNNRPVNVGIINGRAVRLPTPSYPTAARQLRASGKVTVRVTVDESGKVESANAVSGHPLLRRAAEDAALRSRFRPISVNGTPRKSVGTVVYNFVN